ncbi:hypothetical protein LXL04_007204 [Taraxacum kok-saghyz]
MEPAVDLAVVLLPECHILASKQPPEITGPEDFSAAWRFNCLSLHCSSEVPYPPQISIADASVEDKFRRRNPKPALRQASDSDNLVIRPPLLEGIAPSAVFLRDFSAAWRFNCLSLHCSSEVPYPPQISIADASVEDKFRRHNPKPALRYLHRLIGFSPVLQFGKCDIRHFQSMKSTSQNTVNYV